MQNLAETIYILHKSCQPYLFCLFLLASTSYGSAEPTTPGGGGEGGAVGGGGEPLRYAFTARGWNALSPWNDNEYAYSLLQINMGSNPLSKLQVASALNVNNYAQHWLYHNESNRSLKYYPMIYLGTATTEANGWTYETKNGSNLVISNWPNSYQNSSQKGEANI